LSLDDDVASQLHREMRRSGLVLNEAVNHFLRLGLTSATDERQTNRFVVTPRALGLPPGLSYDNVGELLESLEGRA
jgi:hypothetical protein